MKKVFVLGLLLFIGLMFVAPERHVFDQDVGVCYVAPMDQATVDMVSVADYNMIAMPDDRGAMPSVEKDGLNVSTLSVPDAQCSLIMDAHLWQNTSANNGNLAQTDSLRDLGGLDTGEVFPQDRVLSRHI